MFTQIKTPVATHGRLSMHPLSVLLLLSSFGIWLTKGEEGSVKSSKTPVVSAVKGKPLPDKWSLRGHVKDSNGKILSGINVYLKFNHVVMDSAKSTSKGEYQFSKLPAGEYMLMVKDKNYEHYEDTVNLSTKSIRHDIYLNLLKTFNSVKVVGKPRVLIQSATMQYTRTYGVTKGAGLSGRGSRSEVYGNEEYGFVKESRFISTADQSVSTFSSDVDNASYTNVRRMIQQKQKPLIDAVRVEEFINYFDYTYDEPEEDVSIHMESASCPWKPEHQLVKIGLKAKSIKKSEMSRNNLVFLIDVSGSMQEENKLPLVQKALKTLVKNLNSDDQVSIVTYAGYVSLALSSTPCSKAARINSVIDNLTANGSTAGGQGIVMAYQEAKKNYLEEGNNRIILVTDGDFNVGITGQSELLKLIQEKRKEGVYLTVCGFGMGNIKDNTMEMLADNGNGSYYYIDHLKEAERVFGYGLTSTLMTMAKDVKIQVEFNPKYVQAYRLIGYENRLLENEDFKNEAKDAGEMGAGQTVTALYEIIPVGVAMKDSSTVKLKYTRTKVELNDSLNEVLTVKVRYKKPKSSSSIEINQVLMPSQKSFEKASDDFRLASGVALFGMLLRDSEFAANGNYQMVLSLIAGIRNEKVRELLELVKWMDKNKE